MAQIVIDIPAGQTTRVIDGVASYWNYQTTLEGGGANPETKAAFAKRMVILEIKKWVRASEQATAAVTAAASVESGVTLT